MKFPSIFFLGCTVRLGALLMLIFLCFTIFACAEEEKQQEGPQEIYFWHAFTDVARSKWIGEIAEQWNRSQSQYKVIPESKGNYRETLNASILAARQGKGAHLVHVFEVGSQLAFDSQIFVPVSAVGAGDFDFSDYIESVLNYYSIGGKVNSIPFNSSSPILYYNLDLMREAGQEEAPKTFTELLDILAKAKAEGMEDVGFGFNLHSWFFEQWVAQQAGLLVNADNGRSARPTAVLLESPEMQRAFRFVKELNDKGFYKYTGKVEDWSGSEAIFTSGKLMFHMSSTADVGNVREASKGKFEMGTAFMPIPSGIERNGTVIGGGSVWLTKSPPEDQQIAARDFLIFMTNTENMAAWHKLTGYYPVRRSSIELLEKTGWFEQNPVFTTSFEQLLQTQSNSATAGALLGSFLDTRSIIEEAVQQVLNGADIEFALAEANSKANAKLADYNQNVQ